MSKIRRFRAYYIKTDEGTGIGIVEYGDKGKQNWEQDVRAIHSFYDPSNISNRDAQVTIYQFITNQLSDDEHAILQMNKFSFRKGYQLAYKNKISVFRIEYERGRLFHARLLSSDAIRRKSDISEQFDEPMQFSIIQQEKEE